MIESTAIFVKNKQAAFNIDESYAWIFDKYGITEEEFKKSVDYYASDSKTYEEMYDQVIVNLTEKQAELSRTSAPKVEENAEKPALLNAESE